MSACRPASRHVNDGTDVIRTLRAAGSLLVTALAHLDASVAFYGTARGCAANARLIGSASACRPTHR
jgi:hypothetical protein